ncbi:MAG TPA: DNA-binding protein [Nitrospirota bacterium]|nr:DNA-binding protein [Nitrospirota bacterium]
MKRFVNAGLVTLFCAALLAMPVSAQQGFGHMGGRGGMKSEGQQKYDPSQVEIVSGEVAAVKDIETRNGKTSGVGLELNTGGQNLLVYLGPHIYVDLQNVRIVPGDKVEVKGVQTVLDGQIIYLAGEVRKGDEVLKLRDDKGAPLWTGTKQR